MTKWHQKPAGAIGVLVGSAVLGAALLFNGGPLSDPEPEPTRVVIFVVTDTIDPYEPV